MKGPSKGVVAVTAVSRLGWEFGEGFPPPRESQQGRRVRERVANPAVGEGLVLVPRGKGQAEGCEPRRRDLRTDLRTPWDSRPGNSTHFALLSQKESLQMSAKHGLPRGTSLVIHQHLGNKIPFYCLKKITCSLSWVTRQSPNSIITKIGFSSSSCLDITFLGLLTLTKYRGCLRQELVAE